MKKIFLFAFVAFLFLTPVVSASASIAWTPDAISGLGDLGYSLIGGASFDFKNSKYIEGAVDIDDALAEQQASQFLADYCLSRGIGLLNPDELPTSDYEYFKTYYFNSITNKAWNNYRLAQTQAEQDEALKFELSNSLFARWSGYDKLWYKNYIDSFSSSSEELVPNPDPVYQDVLDLILSDPFSSQFSQYNTFLNQGYSLVSSTFYFNDGDNSVHLSNFSNFNNRPNYVFFSPTLNVNLVSNGSTYDIFVTGLPTNPVFYGNNNVYCLNVSPLTGSTFPLGINYDNTYNPSSGRPLPVIDGNLASGNLGNYENLSEALYKVKNTINHCNIFVNGVLWALATDIPSDGPIIPDFNDIIDIDSDDPAYDVVVPVDGVPAWFDLTSLFDAIKLAIIDAKNAASDTDGVLNVDLVLDNDGVVDDTGEVVDTKDEAIDDVLDSPIEIDKTQDYPVIPFYNPPVQNAFKGTSILAELIDGTQTVLPEELILTFWGIVFVIFILGLLKILHK